MKKSIVIFVVLFIISFASVLGSDFSISLNKQYFSVNELVKINLNGNINDITSVVIEYTKTGKQYHAKPKSELVFFPKIPGTYEIKVMKNNKLLSKTSFDVVNKKKHQGFIKEKTVVLGNLALIDFPNGKIPNSVKIQTPNHEFTSYPTREYMNFKPKEIGLHTVFLNYNGNVVDDSFYVVDKKTNLTNQNTVKPSGKVTLSNHILAVNKFGSPLSVNFSVMHKNVKNKNLFARLFRKPVQQDNNISKCVNCTVKINIKNKSIRKIVLNGVHVNNTFKPISVDDVPPRSINIKGEKVLKSFAFDPSGINFKDGTISSIAIGNQLWKCQDWNFSEMKCFGNWTLLQSLVPGNEYEINISPEDPGFVETGAGAINSLKPIYHPGEPADLLIAVLDKEGHLAWNAKVNMTITSPENKTYFFSNNKIGNLGRGMFQLIFKNTSEVGNYSVLIDVKGYNVNFTLQSNFGVQDFYDFDILRKAPMVIDPRFGSKEVKINLTPYINLPSYNFTEVLPSDFNVIIPQNVIKTIVNEKQYLTWQNLNNISNVNYSFNAPYIYPKMYSMRSYISYPGGVFNEYRPWLIVIDPVLIQSCTAISCLERGSSVSCSCSQINASDDIRPIPTNYRLAGRSDAKAEVLSSHSEYTIPDYVSLDTADVCVEWYVSDTSGTTCDISMDTQESGSWNSLTSSCQGSESLVCYDASSHVTTPADASDVRVKVDYYGDKKNQNDYLYVDFVYVNVTAHVDNLSLVSYNLNNDSGTINDYSNITRGEILNANAEWDNIVNLSYCEHNGAGPLINYTVLNPNQWTNYTLNTSDVTEFSSLGLKTVKMYAKSMTYMGSGGYFSNTSVLHFYLWGTPIINSISLNPSYISQGENTTVKCQIKDENVDKNYNNVNVSFYENGTYLGSNKTNLYGWAYYSFNESNQGNYDIVCNITDDVSNYLKVGVNNSKNATLSVIASGGDSSAPTIHWVNATPNPVATNHETNITANVSDNVNVSQVWLIFNSVKHYMNKSGDIWSYVLDTSGLSVGNEDYTVYANDTSNLISSKQGNFTISNNLSVNITTDSQYSQNTIANISISPKVYSNIVSANLTNYIVSTRTSVPWWNLSWKKRKVLSVEELSGSNRQNVLVAVNITGLNGNISSCDELRPIKQEGTNFQELSFNVLSGDDSTWCAINFKTNLTGSQTSNSYYIYYNNTNAPITSYSNQIESQTIFYEDFENNWETRSGVDCDTTPDCTQIGDFTDCDSNSNDYLFCADDSAKDGNWALVIEDWDNPSNDKGFWETFNGNSVCGDWCYDINVSFWFVAYSLDASEWCEVRADDSTQSAVQLYRCTAGDACDLNNQEPPANTYLYEKASLKDAGINLSDSNIDTRIMALQNGVSDECYYDDFNITVYRLASINVSASVGITQTLISENKSYNTEGNPYVWQWNVSDTPLGNYTAFSFATKENYSSAYNYSFFEIVVMGPIIHTVWAVPNTVLYGDNISLYANVSSDYGTLSKVMVEVNSVNYTMSFDSGDTWKYILNTSSLSSGLNPFIVYANDSYNNKATPVSDSFHVSNDLYFKVNTDHLSYSVGNIIYVNTTASDLNGLTNSSVNSIIIKGHGEKPWWNLSWKKRKVLSVEELSGENRTNVLVAYNLTGLNGNISSCDELRPIKQVDNNFQELSFNVLSGDDSTWCAINFKTNLTGGQTSNSYYIYYNNSNAPITSYSNQIESQTIFYEDFENNWETRSGVDCDNTPDCTQIGDFTDCDSNGNDYLFCADDSAKDGNWALVIEDWDTPTNDKGIWDSFNGNSVCGDWCYDINVSFWFVAYSLDGSEWCEVRSDDSTQSAVQLYRCTAGDSCDLGNQEPPASSYIYIKKSLKDAGMNLSDSNLDVRILADQSAATDECYYDDFNITVYRFTSLNISVTLNSTQELVDNQTGFTGNDGNLILGFDSSSYSSGDYTALSQGNKTGFELGYNFSFFEILYNAPPSVTLVKPNDENFTNNATVKFQCHVYDNEKTSNVTLFSNFTATWKENGTINVNTKGITANFTRTLNDGNYIWNCRAFDNTSQESWAESNFSLTVDTVSPNVTLLSPYDGYTSNTSVITFIYNVSENFDINKCYFILDNEVYDTDNTVSTGVNQTFVESLSGGLHNWTVKCADKAGNNDTATDFLINVSAQPVIWGKRWYETSINDCSSDNCSIRLANDRDNTENQITTTVGAGNTSVLVNAYSTYLGSNGVLVPASTTISFSGEFLTNPSNTGKVKWSIYYDNGSDNLICDSSWTSVSTTTTASCDSPSSDLRLLSTERLKLVVEFNNTASSDVTVYHYWDKLRLSYVEFGTFTTLGKVNVEMINPKNSISISQSQTYEQICNVSCYGGSCLNTNVYAQYNTSSLAWTNIGSSGSLVLNDSETNPHNEGTISSDTNSTFIIKGSSSSVNNVRCYATSTYSNDTGETIQQVTVGDSSAPIVSLVNPENYSWKNTENITFIFHVSENVGLNNCSIYIDGNFNQSKNSSELFNNADNNFTINNMNEGKYNWSVECFDNSGLSGDNGTRWFYIDTIKPNISLKLPSDNYTSLSNTVLFNWTLSDNIYQDYLFCNLTLNGSVYRNNISSRNNNWTNITLNLGVGNYLWNITCWDNASNINTSQTRNFTVSDQPPDVDLLYPGNVSWINYNNITFLFNVTEGNSLSNCSIYIDGNFNQSKNSSELINNAQNNFTVYINQEGEHNWTVKCYDNSGLSYTPSVNVFNLDTVAPAVNLIYPKDITLNNADVDFKFNVTDEQANKMHCNLTLDDEILSDQINFTIDNNTLITRNEALLSDDNHNWTVTCWDKANNLAVDNANFTINVSPKVSLISPFPNTWIQDEVTFDFNASDNDDLFNCSLYINNKLNQTLNSTQLLSTKSFYVETMAEGVNQTWYVGCYDYGVFTNYNVSEKRIINVDRTAPWIILNSPNDGTQLNSSDVIFNFTGYDLLSNNLSCNLSISSMGIYEINATNATDEIKEITDFEDGSYKWNVTCTDLSGNQNVSVTKTFNVSEPPTVHLLSPSNNNWSNEKDVNFTFLLYENTGIKNCTLLLNGAVNQTLNGSDVNLNGNNSFNVVNISEGSYNWTVQCIDTVNGIGNGELWNLTVDRHPPVVYRYNPNKDENVSSNNVTFKWGVTDNLAISNDSLKCNLTVSGVVKKNNINVTSGENITENYIYGDGNYTWNVTCWDLAGNYNYTTAWNFTVKAPPDVDLIYPDNDSWNTSLTVNFSYIPYDPIGIRSCSLYIDGVFNQTDSNIERNQLNYFNGLNLSEGKHNWTVNCTDSDWNVYTANESTFYIDKTNPYIILNSPSDGDSMVTQTITFNFTAHDNLAPWLLCNVTVDNTKYFPNLNVTNGNEKDVNITGLEEAIHYWNVTCKDIAGLTNVSETRNFSNYVSPKINLTSPKDNFWSNNVNQTLYFNVSDNTGIENCSLILNGAINQTKNNSEISNNAVNNFTLNNLNGTYTWAIRCYDNSSYFLMNQTGNRTFYVDLGAPNPYIETDNNSWFNTLTPNIDFNISDNMAENVNYTFYVDGSKNSQGNIAVNTSVQKSLNALSDGKHNIVLQANDLAGNSKNSTPIIIYVDTHKPWIDLYAPGNGEQISSNNVTFNFTAHDIMSENLSCSIKLDGSVIQNINTTNNSITLFSYILNGGTHFWNVTCTDLAGNSNISETWNFSSPYPDLRVESEWIKFNSTRLKENEIVSINATVSNEGGLNATDVTVQFFDGNPSSGGNQISSNQTINVSYGKNTTASVQWTPSIGIHNIFVIVDPPLTTNGSLVESNESNNEANVTKIVSMWQLIIGNISGILEVSDNDYNVSFKWKDVRSNNSNIYAVDSDSSINWAQLKALGRNLTGENVSNDFAELDEKLGTTGFPNSVNETFMVGNHPKKEVNFSIYGSNVENVPIDNSTNTSSFVTGILWDSGDGGLEYDKTQDVVFITNTNLNKTGEYGTYDFELKVPAELRDYISTTSSVSLYVELKG